MFAAGSMASSTSTESPLRTGEPSSSPPANSSPMQSSTPGATPSYGSRSVMERYGWRFSTDPPMYPYHGTAHSPGPGAEVSKSSPPPSMNGGFAAMPMGQRPSGSPWSPAQMQPD